MHVTPPRYTDWTLVWAPLVNLWSLHCDSRRLEALQELESGGAMGSMNDSAIAEELKRGWTTSTTTLLTLWTSGLCSGLAA